MTSPAWVDEIVDAVLTVAQPTWADVLAAVAAILSAVVALVAINIARGQLRGLREQMEREARPYVTAQVVPGLHGSGSWDLVVENLGKSMAHGLKVDVGTIQKRDAKDYIAEPLQRFLESELTLVPGARIRVMWSSDFQGSSPAGIQDSRTATLTYWGEADPSRRGKPFIEVYPIYDSTAGHGMPTHNEGARASGTDKDLRNIDSALRALNAHVGELRR
ncbi:hypothetical protein ACIOWF_01090 [Cellulosimicrobium cellulans]|uniref:hypothetical protein n=1 Tax=Cellulosimicrobium cellulans TaxID=1710 RepID=UPI0037F3B5BB